MIPKTVLIIDDSPVVRKLLSNLVNRLLKTVTIYTAGTYDEAVSIMNEKTIDLAIFDYMLDEENEVTYNGIELAKIFKNKFPRSYSILCSAAMRFSYNIPELMRQDIINVYISKPLSENKLCDIINAVLEYNPSLV